MTVMEIAMSFEYSCAVCRGWIYYYTGCEVQVMAEDN